MKPVQAAVTASVLALSALAIFLWRRNKRNYVKVARIAKLYFYPIKSLKGIEVSGGKCTKKGFEVNGLLDRSFMLVNEDGLLVSQRDEPTLVLLTPMIDGKNMVITSPTGDKLTFPIKDSFSADDKIITCKVFTDTMDAVDCGDEVATWFQSFLGNANVRLVRHIPDLPERKYLRSDPFYAKLKKSHPVGFQDLAALHILSNASVQDLNLQLPETKISVKNFRPNIYVDGCAPYAEDCWEYIKFNSGSEAHHIMMTTRCLLTTNNPETGELSKKDPLLTLRKFRLAKDPGIKKDMGTTPCFGVSCAVLQTGEVNVGEDMYAVVVKQPEMISK